MDMELKIAPPFELRAVAPLTQRDLDELAANGPQPTRANSIDRMRLRHHRIARMMALGRKDVEIAASVGVSTGTLAKLKNTPAFRQLCMEYSELDWQEERVFESRIQALRMDVLEKLHDKVESEDLPADFLRQALRDIMDRTGHSPVKKSESRMVHLHLAGSDIQKIKEAARGMEGAARDFQAEDGETITVEPSREVQAEDRGSAGGRELREARTGDGDEASLIRLVDSLP